MKKTFFLLLILCVGKNLLAQNVGIGTTSPNNSAQLDVTSTSKGLLIPRMTGAQRSAIASPVSGLIVYQTNLELFPASSPGFYLYDQSGWKRIARADEISGGTSTWTVNGTDQFSNLSGNVGIGISSPNPSALLDIASTTKGILIPRMTTSQRNAIVNPVAGLLVFDNLVKEFYHHDGTSWKAILNSKYDYWTRAFTRNWVFNNTDSIGLGTPTPDEKLHILDGKIYIQDNRANENPHVIFDVPSVDGNEAGLQFKRSGDTLAAINYIEDAGLPNYIRISAGNAGKVNDLTVNSNGEIGIGTANPNGQMQLTIYTGDNLVINDADGIIQFSAPTFGTPIKKGFIQLANGNDLRLGTNSGNNTGKIIFRSNNTDQVAIDQGGNIGVGTLTPGAKIHIPDGEDADITFGKNGYIMLGNPSSGANLLLDNNEIMVRDGTLLPGTLNIQNDGGEIAIGARTTINKSGEALKLSGVNPNIGFYQSGVSKSFIEQNGNDLFMGANAGNIRIESAGNNSIRLTTNGSGNIQLNPAGTGQVAIGNVVGAASAYKLTVGGKIICEELKVKLQTAGWPDYVFAGDYKLRSLEEVEKFINQHKHLPGIQSAAEVEKNGIEVGDMQKRMMEKIEELTLYIIEMQKQIDKLKETAKD